MNRKTKISLIIASALMLSFIGLIVLLKTVDIQAMVPINIYQKPLDGNLRSIVGLGTINVAFSHAVTANDVLYKLTDWGGLIAFAPIVFFACVGLIQLIKSKKLFGVDYRILLLGLFYIVVVLAFVLFEFVVINRRPVTFNGTSLESSFPSSTTMLAIASLASAILAYKFLVQNKVARIVIDSSLTAYMLFLIIGRVFSGVHWLSDIVGGVLLASALVVGYYSSVTFVQNVKNKNQKTVVNEAQDTNN